MEIRNIRTFLRVAELQSFTHAAAILGYSQSAVTIQIKQLERELEVPLFERIGKRVTLTEHGRQLIPFATNILKTIEAVRTEICRTPEPTGTLRLGVIESLSTCVLPEVLEKYVERCPLVETTIVTGLNSEMFDMLRKNEIDLIYFLDYKVYHSEWVKVIERAEPIVFVAPVGHPLTTKTSVDLTEILMERFILTEKGFCYRHALDQLLAEQGYEIHPMLEMGNIDIILKLLLNHIGISFLPLFAVEKYINAGELAVIPVEGVSIEMWSQLAYHKDKWLTQQMRILIDLMTNHAIK